MKLEKIEEVIATRNILSTETRDRVITVFIGKPRQFPDATDYYCPYQIVGLGSEKVKYAGGVDAIQAIQLAMYMIGADLYTSPEATSGHLQWMGDEQGDLGFPTHSK